MEKNLLLGSEEKNQSERCRDQRADLQLRSRNASAIPEGATRALDLDYWFGSDGEISLRLWVGSSSTFSGWSETQRRQWERRRQQWAIGFWSIQKWVGSNGLIRTKPVWQHNSSWGITARNFGTYISRGKTKMLQPYRLVLWLKKKITLVPMSMAGGHRVVFVSYHLVFRSEFSQS